MHELLRYFEPQSLFSTAIILALRSVLGRDRGRDLAKALGI